MNTLVPDIEVDAPLHATDEGERELCAALASDLDAHFERLVVAYQGRLYAFAMRLAGNAQDGEEIAQDALVKAYRALQKFTPERWQTLRLRAWLYQIALNTFRNRARRKQLPTISTDAADPDGNTFDLPDEAAQRPETLAEQAERLAVLGAHVASLPARHREAVVLRYVQELDYAEIAEVLRQPLGTVKANVHRGLEALRRKYYGNYGDYED